MGVVVIPARDEEDHIGGCLEALAGQTVAPGSFETVLVLDGCIDETGRARGYFEATGVRPSCMSKLESAGIRLPASAFKARKMLID